MPHVLNYPYGIPFIVVVFSSSHGKYCLFISFQMSQINESSLFLKLNPLTKSTDVSMYYGIFFTSVERVPKKYERLNGSCEGALV